MQESKLGDFEFQSIKLLAFRRAVVAAVVVVVVVILAFSRLRLPFSFSLSLNFSPFFPRASLLLALFPPRSLDPLTTVFPLSSLGRPLFPVSSLPPASNGSFAAEIHTDVSPSPSSSSFLLPLCRYHGSSSATHKSTRTPTRILIHTHTQ